MIIDREQAAEAREVLHEYGPLTPLDLAELMGWPYAEAREAIQALEDDGQIYEERPHRYQLTGYGRTERQGGG